MMQIAARAVKILLLIVIDQLVEMATVLFRNSLKLVKNCTWIGNIYRSCLRFGLAAAGCRQQQQILAAVGPDRQYQAAKY